MQTSSLTSFTGKDTEQTFFFTFVIFFTDVIFSQLFDGRRCVMMGVGRFTKKGFVVLVQHQHAGICMRVFLMVQIVILSSLKNIMRTRSISNVFQSGAWISGYASDIGFAC